MKFKYLNLLNLFNLLLFLKNNSDSNYFFKPHEYNFITLLKNYLSKDIFIIGYFRKKIVCYGILRGWEEGYTIPSLGIIVDKKYRGKGFSIEMMNYLHSIAKEKNCDKIMLRVKKDNIKAINLYKSMNYELSDYNEELLIGYKKIIE